MTQVLTRKVCIVITGASKGLGKAISYAFTDYIKLEEKKQQNDINNNDIVITIQPYYYLLGRSMDGLFETKLNLQERLLTLSSKNTTK